MENYDHIKRKTLGYWYVDGLAEIAVGFIFFLLALLMGLIALISPSPAVGLLLAIGQPAAILLGWWGSGKAVRYFKERITYPRTGYIEYRRPKPRRRWKNFILIFIVSFAVASLVASGASAIPEIWLPLFTAVPIAIFVVYLAIQVGLVRLYPVAAAILLTGFLPVLFGLIGAPASALLLAAIASVWWASGALALRSYLQNTQPPAFGQPQ